MDIWAPCMCAPPALALWYAPEHRPRRQIVSFRGWRRTALMLGETQVTLADTHRVLAERQRERDTWRKSAEEALAGFSRAIDSQFDEWQLTRAEREVALLILKGAGHKQAAAALGRSHADEADARWNVVEV